MDGGYEGTFCEESLGDEIVRSAVRARYARFEGTIN